MILRDLNNPAFVSELSPEAEWKRSLIIECGRLFGLRIFVETGTCKGDTVAAVRPYFDRIFSIELSPVFYDEAKKRFQHEMQINIFQGSSGQILEPVLSVVPKGPVLFWLDAHKTGDQNTPTGDAGNQVTAELDTINRLRPDSLVLIDDVKPHEDGFHAPDGLIPSWNWGHVKFLHGVLILDNGNYNFPEKF